MTSQTQHQDILSQPDLIDDFVQETEEVRASSLSPGTGAVPGNNSSQDIVPVVNNATAVPKAVTNDPAAFPNPLPINIPELTPEQAKVMEDTLRAYKLGKQKMETVPPHPPAADTICTDCQMVIDDEYLKLQVVKNPTGSRFCRACEAVQVVASSSQPQPGEKPSFPEGQVSNSDTKDNKEEVDPTPTPTAVSSASGVPTVTANTSTSFPFGIPGTPKSNEKPKPKLPSNAGSSSLINNNRQGGKMECTPSKWNEDALAVGRNLNADSTPGQWVQIPVVDFRGKTLQGSTTSYTPIIGQVRAHSGGLKISDLSEHPGEGTSSSSSAISPGSSRNIFVRAERGDKGIRLIYSASKSQVVTPRPLATPPPRQHHKSIQAVSDRATGNLGRFPPFYVSPVEKLHGVCWCCFSIAYDDQHCEKYKWSFDLDATPADILDHKSKFAPYGSDSTKIDYPSAIGHGMCTCCYDEHDARLVLPFLTLTGNANFQNEEEDEEEENELTENEGGNDADDESEKSGDEDNEGGAVAKSSSTELTMKFAQPGHFIPGIQGITAAEGMRPAPVFGQAIKSITMDADSAKPGPKSKQNLSVSFSGLETEAFALTGKDVKDKDTAVVPFSSKKRTAEDMEEPLFISASEAENYKKFCQYQAQQAQKIRFVSDNITPQVSIPTSNPRVLIQDVNINDATSLNVMPPPAPRSNLIERLDDASKIKKSEPLAVAEDVSDVDEIPKEPHSERSCWFCDSTFSNMETLRKHLRRHNLPIPPSKLKVNLKYEHGMCYIHNCEKVTTKRREMMAHLIKEHQAIPVPKPFRRGESIPSPTGPTPAPAVASTAPKGIKTVPKPKEVSKKKTPAPSKKNEVAPPNPSPRRTRNGQVKKPSKFDDFVKQESPE